ncbi:MAG: endonuclease/exonuclease/phosphatase family protein [Leptospiraceae bacterium]|nr:endonuclease/exonuclease/phosphatase family protein [Leptospiraceae bacterium]
MKLGIWNVDLPEYGSSKLKEIKSILLKEEFDIIFLTEVNASLEFEGYKSIYSKNSPFKNTSRNYNPPNVYYQAAIYTKFDISKNEIDDETAINATSCFTNYHEKTLELYSCVFTIKDRWAKWSNMKYKDRVIEQIKSFDALKLENTIIGGDFNCKSNSSYNKFGYISVNEFVEKNNLNWITRNEEDTCQQLITTKNFNAEYELIKNKRLSHHPLVIANITF